uniref:Uncharacterized protein n=1 Tax=Leersia perrieri TaxID=77586 RepID=A0A0D9XZJ6_9ORYZ
MARLGLSSPALVTAAVEADDWPPLPWDVARERLAELLRYLAAALPELAAWLRGCADTAARLARSALPAAAAVALLVVLCCCCGYFCCGGGGGRRRRRGPDGEEVDGGGGNGPVVSYRGGGGGYKGGIFNLHPNKPIRG